MSMESISDSFFAHLYPVESFSKKSCFSDRKNFIGWLVRHISFSTFDPNFHNGLHCYSTHDGRTMIVLHSALSDSKGSQAAYFDIYQRPGSVVGLLDQDGLEPEYGLRIPKLHEATRKPLNGPWDDRLIQFILTPLLLKCERHWKRPTELY